MVESVEVLIVGGGLVGLALAKGLEKQNISYRLLDERLSATPPSARALALSKTSLAILRYLDIWQNLKSLVTPISSIDVSCEGAIGRTFLDNAEHDFLGVVANLNDLQQALKNGLSQQEHLIEGRFTSYCPEKKWVYAEVDGQQRVFNANIIVAADGANSSVRGFCHLPVEHAIEQQAILSVLQFNQPHKGLAYERFTAHGPMALLPWQQDQMVLVYCVSNERAQYIQQEGAQYLQSYISSQLGPNGRHLLSCSELNSYPLRQVFMPRQTYQNVLFLGNAAHTLHPVAGQGFNLSLRDVAVFLDVMQQFGVGPESFPMYLTQRVQDQRLTKYLTYFLAEGFNRISPHARGLGLSIVEGSPLFKNIISFYAQGLGYPLPRWVYQQMEYLYD
jgi:2-octaprenyl-6-methoxyphenol hydroxylase